MAACGERTLRGDSPDGSILDKVRASFDGLVASPGHYANMTHPDFNHLGVGVAVEGRSFWVTQNLAYYP